MYRNLKKAEENQITHHSSLITQDLKAEEETNAGGGSPYRESEGEESKKAKAEEKQITHHPSLITHDLKIEEEANAVGGAPFRESEGEESRKAKAEAKAKENEITYHSSSITHDLKAEENQDSPLRHPSVHLTDLTIPESDVIDPALEQRMDYAQRISSLVLSLRKKEKIRVRQPLQRVLLPVLNAEFIAHVDQVKDLILSEVNVKEIEYLTDASGILKKKAKANFKVLGKKIGKHMKDAAALIAAFTPTDIATLEKTNTYAMSINGDQFDLSLEDIEIVTEDIPGWQVASDDDLVVALDVTLNDELIAEGYARDLVNRIQNLRKDKGFNVTDRIEVVVSEHPDVVKAVDGYADYIKSETLTQSLVVDNVNDGEIVEWLDGGELRLTLKPA
jgi:hypothetical protein